jgi:hypothetical protein
MSENIGSIYNTQIPAYEDGADIKAALKLYHYGQESEPATEEDVPSESIAGHLIDLQEQIDSLGNNAGIQASIVDAKGDIIVATGADTVVRRSVGTNNQVLAADNSETTGIKWTAATDLISAASTSAAGKVQLEDSVSSTSTTKAATPNSVKTVNDSLSTVSGTVTTLSADVQTLSTAIAPSTKTASYSLVPTDAGKTVIMNVSTGSASVTVPPQSSQTFTANAKIDIVQTGSVQVEIVPGAGVTINSKNSNKKIAAQYSGATLIRVSSDSWVLIGDLIA